MKELLLNPKEFIWSQKYRPQKIEDMVLPEEVKKAILGNIKKGSIPHYIFSGPAGIGKTTAALCIANELGADYLLLNASKENGIDVIRSKITNFASTVSFDGGTKIVIMDECLEENEKVRIGTVDDWEGIPLKELELGKEYDIVSFNENTGELENDRGQLISDRFDEVFEVELEDGRKIIINDKHPLLVEDENGDRKWTSISEGGVSVLSKIICL